VYWAFFVLCAILSIYSFYPLVFILGSQFVWSLVAYRKRIRVVKRIICSYGVLFLSVVPLISIFIETFHRKYNFGTGHWGWQGKEFFLGVLSHFGGMATLFPLGVLVFIVGLIVLTLKKRAVQQVSFIASVISGTIICYCPIHISTFSYTCSHNNSVEDL